MFSVPFSAKIFFVAVVAASAESSAGLRGSDRSHQGGHHSGVLEGNFVLQKRYDLSQNPAIDFDIESHSDEFLTHSCANYVDDGSTVFSRNGQLVLKVASHCEEGGCMNSGRVMSRDGFKYGLFTFSARVPKCHHVWPAIWMLPEDYHGNGTYGRWPCSGEIDILETVHDEGSGTFNLVAGYGTEEMGCLDNQLEESQGNVSNTSGLSCNKCIPNYCTSTTMHPETFKGLNPYYVQHKVNCSAGEESWEQHRWVMNWQPNEVTTWVDPELEWNAAGRLIRVTPKPRSEEAEELGIPTWRTFHRSSTPTWKAVRSFMDMCFAEDSESSAPFDQPFKIVLNIAIGGYGGSPCSWGSDTCQTVCGGAVGAELVISDISVWQKTSW